MRSYPIQVFLLALLTLLPFVEASASTGGGTKGTVPQSESAPEIESADKTGLTLSGYASIDLVSGYAYRGSLLNDEPCYWTYGELNLGYQDVFSFGTWIFQSTDMTCCRKDEMRRMNEWDFGLDCRAKFELAYWFNAHFGLRALLNYSVLVDDTVRTGCETYDGPYKKDFLFGGVGACLAF